MKMTVKNKMMKKDYWLIIKKIKNKIILIRWYAVVQTDRNRRLKKWGINEEVNWLNICIKKLTDYIFLSYIITIYFLAIYITQ